jgi:hypothetical protein
MAEDEKRMECKDCGDTGPGPEKTSKIWVKDRFVDAYGIDDIIEDVFHMNIKDRNRIADELMSRFLENNQIPDGLEKDYRTALVDEYEIRLLPYL